MLYCFDYEFTWFKKPMVSVINTMKIRSYFNQSVSMCQRIQLKIQRSIQKFECKTIYFILIPEFSFFISIVSNIFFFWDSYVLYSILWRILFFYIFCLLLISPSFFSWWSNNKVHIIHLCRNHFFSWHLWFGKKVQYFVG